VLDDEDGVKLKAKDTGEALADVTLLVALMLEVPMPLTPP
jgi:hypothetical protein